MNTAETIRHPHPVTTRSPNGCPRQVMTQLTLEEHRLLKEYALGEGRSVSGTVRLLVIEGLKRRGIEPAPIPSA
ncbi:MULTISPECIES: hypothetical protein [Halomonas]|uniref:hypothetical protein n=1 Tax=Halomonas TaxID=2745 RepID=UPI001C94227B|nr:MULTISPECIES: hypothetical protein [Halomonas]MBY6206908.1 hypothetical protein [Halomonas sp. DP3Y7-2]MBY6230382.1 hypothetical protein [Halomonas sp. DP3Y7-1]MCA0918542.1 hypothetical protein [Halomonas denitrificans]